MHVLIKFFLLISLAITLTHLSINYQIVLFVFLVTGAVLSHLKSFSNMLRRVRWLILILLVIYAFSTPGEYVSGFPVELSPSYEGIRAGIMQVVKIIIMLAALSILLTTTPREILIGGIYQLLRPFGIFKVDAKKFAVRIWLTMHYVESQTLKTRQKLSTSQVLEAIDLDDINDSMHTMPEITISIMPFTKLDIILIAFVLTLFYFFLVN
jgi:energy-coupling factor transporter transmembrane protein EcfT